MVLFITSACHIPNKNIEMLTNQSTVIVDDENILKVDGFILGGMNSSRQREAVSDVYRVCFDLAARIHATFEQFRLIDVDPNSLCEEIVNESPYDRGFHYVARPSIKYQLEPGTQVQIEDGVEIEGGRFGRLSLRDAYKSFLDRCFRELKAYKEKLGESMIIGSCGEPQTNLLNTPTHFNDLPHLKITSKIKLYLRADYNQNPVDTYELKSRDLVEIPGLAQAIVGSGRTQNEVIIPTFYGSLTKINIESGRKVWEKNLTNPEPSGFRQTTSLNTVAVSSDNKWVAVGGNYGYLAIVDGDTGDKTRIITCHPQMFAPKHYQALAFTKDRRGLLSVASQGQYPTSSRSYRSKDYNGIDSFREANYLIEYRNTESGAIIWSQTYSAKGVLEVSFNVDERFVYLVTSGSVILLDKNSGDILKEYALSYYEGNLRSSFISGASFSNDLKLLAIWIVRMNRLYPRIQLSYFLQICMFLQQLYLNK